jgi:hypothetical protein
VLGEENMLIKNIPSNHNRKPFPQRPYLPSLRIAVPDQKLQLMGHQPLQLPDPIAGPPSKMPLAQPLLTELKPLRIIGQYLEGRPSLVAKNKQSPRKGIALQQLPACPG